MKSKNYNILLSYGIGDGNILKTENINYFVEEELKGKKCELVTADGGIECISDDSYTYQELYNVKLFFAEMLMALKINSKGGTFIMKIYDCFYKPTINILTLLTKFYETIEITKPHTSRPASSERYVICKGFQGVDQQTLANLGSVLEEWVKIEPKFEYMKNELFVQSFLNFQENNESEFIQNLKKSNEDCINFQLEKIEEGLDLAEKAENIGIKKNEIINRKKKQITYALKWCKQHKVPYLSSKQLNSFIKEYKY